MMAKCMSVGILFVFLCGQSASAKDFPRIPIPIEMNPQECALALKGFLGLKENEKRNFNGGNIHSGLFRKPTRYGCKFHLSYSKKNGIGHSVDLGTYFEEEENSNVYEKGLEISLGEKLENYDYVFYSCQAKGDSFILDYSIKETKGWNKSYLRVKSKIEKSAGAIQKIYAGHFFSGAWFRNGFMQEWNCDTSLTTEKPKKKSATPKSEDSIESEDSGPASSAL